MQKSSDLGGIIAILAATATFTVGDAFMKLAAEQLPPFQVLVLRCLVAGVVCTALVTLRREWHAIAGVFSLRALLRALGEALNTLCYVVALTLMPLADVIAILQTAPLILIIGAAVFYRERIGAARALLILLGFAGALMVAQPGASGFSSAALLAFGAAAFIAARDIVGRGVPSDIPVSVVILTTLLVSLVVAGTASFAVETWVTPTTTQMALLGGAGLCLCLGHVGLFMAYRLGKTAVVAPFFYSFAVWGVVAGLVYWGTLPNTLALAGIALIAASGVAIVLLGRREKGMATDSGSPNPVVMPPQAVSQKS